MGLKNAFIIFDNQHATYYVGQTVTGRVEITVDSPKKLRGIKIRFKGEANVQWSEQETRTNNDGKDERETITMLGEEVYFNTEYFLIGGQSSEIVLPIGNHVYPFTCVLPPTLPSSFEGDYGHVRYTIKVILDRPWKFDQEIKAAFTVISPLDLNVNPSLTKPIKIHLEKYFCCCFCKSGPLTCVVSLPYTGFVPGQTVPILAEVDNISNIEIQNVAFSFRKKVAYHSRTPRHSIKYDVINLETKSFGAVEAHGSKTFNQPVVVPPLPPSNLTNCSLIDLDYELYVEVVVTGMHRNLTGQIPIVIGTVPLNMNFINHPQPGSVSVNMSTYPNQSQIGWVANTDDPPTYAECQFGTKSIQDSKDNQHIMFAGDNSNYSPRYPVFNFAPSAPPQMN